jgi:hypothetical protein
MDMDCVLWEVGTEALCTIYKVCQSSNRMQEILNNKLLIIKSEKILI